MRVAQIATYYSDRSDLADMLSLITRHIRIDPDTLMAELMPIVRNLRSVDRRSLGILVLGELLKLDPSAVDSYSLDVDIDENLEYFYALRPSAIQVYYKRSNEGRSWNMIREYPL